jgi:hypothetical protein
MSMIDFMFHAEDLSQPHLTGHPRGWIVCHPHSITGKEHALSPECLTASDLERCAEDLKKQLDRVVREAREKLPKD